MYKFVFLEQYLILKDKSTKKRSQNDLKRICKLMGETFLSLSLWIVQLSPENLSRLS